MFIGKVVSAVTNFKELIGVFSFYFLLVAHPLSPDLEVNYDKSPYFVLNTSEPLSLFGNEVTAKDSSVFTLTLANKSKDPITDMEVEIGGVVKIDSIGGRSSSIRINDEISNKVEIEEKDNYRVFLKNVKSIPAGHNIQIQMTGQFLDLLVKGRVRVTSSAKTQHVSEMHNVTGLWGLFYSQSDTFFAIISVILILVGLKRFYNDGVIK
ncbi:hypothetical protein ACFL2V_17540 [Pseudomonadota bacterium]